MFHPLFLVASLPYIITQVVSWPSIWRARVHFPWYLFHQDLTRRFLHQTMSCDDTVQVSSQMWWMLYLHSSFLYLTANLRSLPRFVPRWSLEQGLGHLKDVSVSLESLGIIVTLCLWWVTIFSLRIRCQYFPKSSLLTLASCHLSMFSDSRPPTIIKK